MAFGHKLYSWSLKSLLVAVGHKKCVLRGTVEPLAKTYRFMWLKVMLVAGSHMSEFMS